MKKIKEESAVDQVAQSQQVDGDPAAVNATMPVAETVEIPAAAADPSAKYYVPKSATTPSLGRVVIFKVSEEAATQINRRRTTGYEIARRIALNCNSQTLWPIGAQAHIGNEVKPGDEFTAFVVRVWSETCVNLQVFLDGNDVYWATSVSEGEHGGMWHWPVRG